ncbi:proton channel OtopLc isoform X2 [Parasteatoda tepidariorum]|uniref:proton channel OtopLc isoform X2 n=1 Tax=Parasteatoda tepidariorum TaxID=114398 RepID=UPI001C71FAE8|nr:proton channel OtopLc isoform X2 [Parasteatoda tepidariorum]
MNRKLTTGARLKLYQTRRSDSEPVGMEYNELQLHNIRMDSKMPASEDSGIDIYKTVPKTNLQINGLDKNLKSSSAPSSPGKLYHKLNERNNLLGIPPSGPFLTLTPKPLRRTYSARLDNDFSHGSSSPRIRRIIRPTSLCVGNEFYGDSVSVINVPAGQSNPYREISEENRSLSVVMSGIYAVFLLMFGAIIYMNDQHRAQKFSSEVFSSVISLMGLLWLIIFHVDLCRYKNTVLKQLKEREDAMQEASEKFSVATEYIINSGFNIPLKENATEGKKLEPPPYRFLLGRHSGSFYLKIGSACFCFGYLIYQGLQLGQHILNFLDDEMKLLNCSRHSSVVLHVIAPIFAFYQLFITFKYSNIVINRMKALARFGLMHLIATCMCNWFNTIVDEAVEDYTHMTNNVSLSEFDIATFHITVERSKELGHPVNCTSNSILSTRSMSAIPYLYPFAIEYNLLLAGVWFIVWQNIGKEHTHANPHHLRHTISQDEEGSEAIAYQSNLVINADCHASNKGLFSGLFLMLTVVVTVIVFFVAMSTKGYQSKAVIIHTCQEGVLTIIGLITVIISSYQIRKLDRSEHPITFLDDVLLFVPLPFFFVHGIMSIMSEIDNENYSRLALHILVTIQVVVQTPFIIDGLRRCSNSQVLRYKKPGREVITFMIILNLTVWIVNTFELKSVEQYHGQGEYFGELVWLFIGHTSLPLMLFYRFHSSVCLADMWKSAYEKEL